MRNGERIITDFEPTTVIFIRDEFYAPEVTVGDTLLPTNFSPLILLAVPLFEVKKNLQGIPPKAQPPTHKKSSSRSPSDTE